MSEEQYDFIFKVLLLGNNDVVKSSIILRYVDQIWSETFVPTISVDFKVKTMEVDNKSIKIKYRIQMDKIVLEQLFLLILEDHMVYSLFMILQIGIHLKI